MGLGEELKQWSEMARQVQFKVGRFAREKLGRSPRWLEKYSKQTYGQTPREIFTKFRILEIERALQRGQYEKEITDTLGFRQIQALSRAYRRSTGRTIRETKRVIARNAFSKVGSLS